MSYIRVDTASLIPGAVVVSNSAGFGVLAQDVPSSGANGPGIAYPSLSFPADTGKEVRIALTSWPPSGALALYEDTSFEYEGPSFSTTYQLYLDGVAVGAPQVFSVELPETAVTVSPGKGAIQVRGYAPTVVVGGAVAVSPGKGVIQIHGYAPTVVAGDAVTVAAAGGRVRVTGGLATLTQGQAETPPPLPSTTCRLYVKVAGIYVAHSIQ